jgi:hypothetical protein
MGSFVLVTSSRLALGPFEPPIQWVPGLLPQGSSGRHHSPPSRAEVKNAWSYTSTTLVRLWCLIKQEINVFISLCLFRYRDRFTFNF